MAPQDIPSLAQAYIPKVILASVCLSLLRQSYSWWNLRNQSPCGRAEVRLLVTQKYRQFNDGYFLLPHNDRDRTIAFRPFGVTFLCSLFVNMEYGILIGAGIHLLLLAYIGNRPHSELIRLPVSLIT